MDLQYFEIKTEADSNDETECSHDDKPSTFGMFAVSDAIISAVSCLYVLSAQSRGQFI